MPRYGHVGEIDPDRLLRLLVVSIYGILSTLLADLCLTRIRDNQMTSNVSNWFALWSLKISVVLCVLLCLASVGFRLERHWPFLLHMAKGLLTPLSATFYWHAEALFVPIPVVFEFVSRLFRFGDRHSLPQK